MLTVNVDSWLEKLGRVDWEEVWPDDFEDVFSRLKAIVPCDLHDRIDRSMVKARIGENGAKEVFIVLEGNKETGEQLVFEIMAGPMHSPDHIHGETPDADYGEMYWTLSGGITDTADDGRWFVHRRGMPPMVHGPNTRHQPRVASWWIGVFYHPCASRLAE